MASIKSCEELEALLRAGEMALVAKSIASINRNKIPRAELARYSNIANRVHQYRLAYRFLHSILRTPKLTVPATDLEKIEYAEALRGLGLIGEAKQILEEIDFNAEPIAALRIGFCLMTQWKYAEAIPFLRQYIAAIPETEYAWLIANVNLAAALVAERQDFESLELLNLLKQRTKEGSHQLLYGNCLELLTQLLVAQGEYAKADAVLDEATQIFSASRSRYSLYLRKWRAISKSLRTKTADSELLKCREAAAQDLEWETVRDCDLHIGFLRQNQTLLQHVYFGTPSQVYRKRVLGLLGIQKFPTESYIWNQCPAEEVMVVFDVLKGQFDGSTESLEVGQLMHRMLILLASDFYRPLSIATAFSELFPGEHFSQAGSTNRVCQIIKRLRGWLKDHGDHLSVEEIDGAYSLRARAGVGLRMSLDRPSLSPQAVTWSHFKKTLVAEANDVHFSRQDVVRTLQCSPASANRLLRWSLDQGEAESVGAGPHRKYRLVA